jgi:hypothetical protein
MTDVSILSSEKLFEWLLFLSSENGHQMIECLALLDFQKHGGYFGWYRGFSSGFGSTLEAV